MAFLKLLYEQQDYRSLKNGDMTAVEFMDKLMQDPGTPGDPEGGTANEIICYLMEEHSGEGGSYEIDSFEVVEADYDTKTKKGKVEIQYWIYYFFGCSDLNNETDSYHVWRFQVDTGTKAVYLDIPEYEKRSTLDEF